MLSSWLKRSYNKHLDALEVIYKDGMKNRLASQIER